MKEFLIGFLIVVVLGGVCIFSKGVSVYNTHIDLKNQIEAKQKANEAIFDNTWKKINQTVQVSDKYKDGLKEVLLAYTSGRSKGDSQLLMDWTKRPFLLLTLLFTNR